MQKEVAFNERDFFKDPFTRDEIENLLQGRPASEMFSFMSPSFKALGRKREKLSDGELIDLMLGEPRLIRRPMVKIGQEVRFGADPKTLAEILKS